MKSPPTEIIEATLANPWHAACVMTLLNEYALDVMGGGVALSAFTNANLITQLQKRLGTVVLLAFVLQQPVGLLIAFEGFSTFACKPLLAIHDLIVTSAYRNQGIAKLLLLKIETLARERGACKLTLEVLEGNYPAKAVYKACGFAGYTLHADMGSAQFWQKNLEVLDV